MSTYLSRIDSDPLGFRLTRDWTVNESGSKRELGLRGAVLPRDGRITLSAALTPKDPESRFVRLVFSF